MIGEFFSTAILLFIVWSALTGLAPQEILVGAGMAVLISIMVTIWFIPSRASRITVGGLFRLLQFIPKFILYETINHLKLIRIIYSPKMPIDPAIVEVPMKLKKNLQITAVATSVTMLPGTFTLDYGDGKLYIHAIDRNDNPVEFTHRLEDEIGRAFS